MGELYQRHRSWLVDLIPFVMILGVLLVIYATILTNRHIGSNNTAYVRVLDCIIAKNATQRTQADIEHCYKVVERDFNTHLTRYDKL